MGLESFLKFGYILMIVTVTLMIWASLARASSREMEQMKYPPCTYNPLCTCSKAAPDLGIVHCRNVPFPAIPKMVNNSKVFMLHMENTGLREIEPYFLQATGMYRLKISNNHLTEIPDDAFTGLERSLWELILPHNDLIEIPSKSFRHLQKIRHLDLSYNHITFIGHDSFRGLEDSLQTLMLKENSISMLPPHGFSGLLLLETLDLSGNNLYEIDPSVFKDGMPRLSKLLLTDNMLSEIPYIEISPLKMLRTLDLSHNVITSMTPNNTAGKSTVKLNLDNLHMEYNHIDKLFTSSFINFDVVNRTFFDGNPIVNVMADAFKPAKIREIYMRYCGLTHISPAAFDSLVNSLQILDLSGNNLTNLPDKVFNNFDFLRVLSLRDNQIKITAPVEMFNVFQYTLFKLDLSGELNSATNLQELRKMRNMRSLSISRMNTQALSPEEFMDFGVELEDLQVTRSGITSVKSHAFKHVRGLKRLDLSENAIGTIENDAFVEIGHSLISFKISHGYAGNALPSDALRHLTSLQELDFSNNKITSMSDTSFHFLKNLRLLELHDNRIEQVMKGTFQGDIHSKLEEISFRFNNLKQISQHTFFDLEALQKLHLDDNKIDKVERRSFMNLDRLEYLSLRGNKLTTVSEESFQIYESDPLPKNICRKCIANVTLIFDECQKILKVQKKWIDNVRTNQPDHPYIYVLDLIERSSRDMVRNIKGVAPDFQFRALRPSVQLSSTRLTEADEEFDKDLQMDTNALTNDVQPSVKLFKFNNPHDDTQQKKKENPRPPAHLDKRKLRPSLDTSSLRISKADGIIGCGSKDPAAAIPSATIPVKKELSNFPIVPKQEPVSPPPTSQNNMQPPNLNLQNKIKEIKHKLQSNGCTLMSINSTLSGGMIRVKTVTNVARVMVECKLCCRGFPNTKFLAKHQLDHLSISDKRIFERKYLEKKVRRGRLIPMGDKKAIRCLNCWKIFADNRGILDHWSKGECDYFCQICGKEFPSNPKMLREHVPMAHGISYKSSRRRAVKQEPPPKFVVRDLYNKTTTPFVHQSMNSSSTVIKSEPVDNDLLKNPILERKSKKKKQSLNAQGRVSCSICFCTFPNFQSKNSHMRKHKNRPAVATSTFTISKTTNSNNAEKYNLAKLNTITTPQIKLEPEDNYEVVMEFSTDRHRKVPMQTTTSKGISYPPRLQVKKLSDLQDPCISSQLSEESSRSYSDLGEDQIAKRNVEDHYDYGRIYNCHPCGEKFSSKTDLFEHKRQCQSNNKFACRFCLRAFVTSADLQMHIMLMHRDS